MGEGSGCLIQSYLPPGNLVNKHSTSRALRRVGCSSLLAQTLVSLESSHPSLFFLVPTPRLFPGGLLGRLSSLSRNPRLFDTAGLGGLLLTKTSQSVFFFSVLYAPSRFLNMPLQSVPGVVLLLSLAAEGRVTEVYVVFVTGVLLMPLDAVHVAELTATAAALHDGLPFPTAVYLGRTAAKWAPNNVGDFQSDCLDQESFESVSAADRNE